MKLKLLAGVIAGALLCGAASAHHSFAAEFDSDQPIELKGIVTKVEWTNPHVWFYINVRDTDSGETANWGAEMGPPHLLQRQGWLRESLAIGERVTVNGFLARNGSNRVNARSVTLTSTGGRPGETLDASSSIDQE
jgi:hypothetical protein